MFIECFDPKQNDVQIILTSYETEVLTQKQLWSVHEGE